MKILTNLTFDWGNVKNVNLLVYIKNYAYLCRVKIKRHILTTIKQYIMKIRVYDYGTNTELGCARYTMYLPYPKQLQSEIGMKAWGFGFNCNTNYGNFFLRYETLEFPNGMCGVNLGKKAKIEDLPKFMQDYIIRLEKAFNEACKFNDDEHWKTFRIVLNNI